MPAISAQIALASTMSAPLILMGLGAILLAAVVYGLISNVIDNFLFRGRIKPLSKRTLWTLTGLSVASFVIGGGMYAVIGMA